MIISQGVQKNTVNLNFMSNELAKIPLKSVNPEYCRGYRTCFQIYRPHSQIYRKLYWIYRKLS